MIRAERQIIRNYAGCTFEQSGEIKKHDVSKALHQFGCSNESAIDYTPGARFIREKGDGVRFYH